MFSTISCFFPFFLDQSIGQLRTNEAHTLNEMISQFCTANEIWLHDDVTEEGINK